MSLKKNEMPSQAPEIRNKNFLEVALGYTPEQAIDEAKRCLNCKNKPCVDGCPVKIYIPEFIAKVAEGDFDAAYDALIFAMNTDTQIRYRVFDAVYRILQYKLSLQA